MSEKLFTKTVILVFSRVGFLEVFSLVFFHTAWFVYLGDLRFFFFTMIRKDFYKKHKTIFKVRQCI